MDELTVFGAVKAELEEMAHRAPGIDRSALAASALALAKAMDDPDNSATSKSMCAARLNETLDRLYEKAPEEPQEDSPLDELRARRQRRLEGGAAASG